MPNYNFRNKETGEEFIESMTIAELDQYIIDNPHLEQFIGKVNFVYSVHGEIKKKIPGDFNSILKKIKKDYPGSTIETF